MALTITIANPPCETTDRVELDAWVISPILIGLWFFIVLLSCFFHRKGRGDAVSTLYKYTTGRASSGSPKHVRHALDEKTKKGIRNENQEGVDKT
jgi:hypothetical protein